MIAILYLKWYNDHVTEGDIVDKVQSQVFANPKGTYVDLT